MTKIVYDSQKLVKGVIGNVNSTITNLNEAKRIVGSLDIPSLNSEGYIRGLSSTIDDIVASCNLCINDIQDSSKRFNDTIDNNCTEISKVETHSITAKDFYVINK